MSGTGDITSGILDTLDRGATLTERVYGRLRRGLIVGAWAPGDRLSARAISREMDVSLTPVREAMLRLANEGALELTATRSFRTPVLSRDEYNEMLRIRLALEPMAAGLAAEKITAVRIDSIEALNERLAALLAVDAFVEAFEADVEFHLSVYDEAAQPLLRSIIASLLLRAGPTRSRLPRAYRKTLAGYDHHRRIIAALRTGNPDAARDAVVSDLTEGAAKVLETLTD